MRTVDPSGCGWIRGVFVVSVVLVINGPWNVNLHPHRLQRCALGKRVGKRVAWSDTMSLHGAVHGKRPCDSRIAQRRVPSDPSDHVLRRPFLNFGQPRRRTYLNSEFAAQGHRLCAVA